MGWFSRQRKAPEEKLQGKNERLQEEHRKIINQMILDHKNQNTMTRQDYITAIRNGEYCIENDDTEALISLINEIFPEGNGATGLSDFYFKDFTKGYQWSNAKNKPPNMKSIKASTLANMKDIKDKELRIRKAISPEEAQKIINIACEKWKLQLASLWSNKMVLHEYIHISEEFYQEMRSACTPDQHKLFDEIFGTDKPELKSGDCIIIHGDPTMVWELRDDNLLCSLNWNTRIWQQKVAAIRWRHATPEEIRAAQYPPDGTPCWVRNKPDEAWHFRYADRDGKFYIQQRKTGTAIEYSEFKPFDPNNLPFNA